MRCLLLVVLLIASVGSVECSESLIDFLTQKFIQVRPYIRLLIDRLNTGSENEFAVFFRRGVNQFYLTAVSTLWILK